MNNASSGSNDPLLTDTSIGSAKVSRSLELETSDLYRVLLPMLKKHQKKVPFSDNL